MPKVLFDNTDFDYPAYNNNIPDLARADWFVEDVEQYRQEARWRAAAVHEYRYLQRPRRRARADAGLSLCVQLHGRQ